MDIGTIYGCGEKKRETLIRDYVEDEEEEIKGSSRQCNLIS